MFLARNYTVNRQFADAVSILQAIPSDAEQTIGRELQAQARYWRSLALAGQGNLEAAQSESDRHANYSGYPGVAAERDRAPFAARADIRQSGDPPAQTFQHPARSRHPESCGAECERLAVDSGVFCSGGARYSFYPKGPIGSTWLGVRRGGEGWVMES